MKQIIYFTAEWCSPCKTLSPIMDKVKTNSGLNINKINVDNNKELVMHYNVKSIPTVIILEDNIEVRRFTGVKSEIEILNMLK